MTHEIEIYELTETKGTVTVVFSTTENDWNQVQITKWALKDYLINHSSADAFEGIDMMHYLNDNLLLVVTEYLDFNLQEVA